MEKNVKSVLLRHTRCTALKVNSLADQKGHANLRTSV